MLSYCHRAHIRLFRMYYIRHDWYYIYTVQLYLAEIRSWVRFGNIMWWKEYCFHLFCWWKKNKHCCHFLKAQKLVPCLYYNNFNQPLYSILVRTSKWNFKITGDNFESINFLYWIILKDRLKSIFFDKNVHVLSLVEVFLIKTQHNEKFKW